MTALQKRTRAVRRANCFCLLLLLIGGLQIIGYCLGSRSLRAIGATTVLSPFPKVFCSAPVHSDPRMKLETFSARFALRYRMEGRWVEMKLTPEIYSRLRGPYNRRNVYGAVLAYGPCLPPDLVRATLRHALVEPAPMREELGIPGEASDLRVVIRGRAGGRIREWEIPAEASAPPPVSAKQ